MSGRKKPTSKENTISDSFASFLASTCVLGAVFPSENIVYSVVGMKQKIYFCRITLLQITKTT